jgi:UDP-N-acetyl-D-mannosaminuronic acid dehydrogenase
MTARGRTGVFAMSEAEVGSFGWDVVIIGGCGHVGLPLGIALADRGMRTLVYDINDTTVQKVNAGVMPFDEPGAQQMFERAVADERLHATSDPSSVGLAEHVIVVIGTPVDKHLNPDPNAILNALQDCLPHFRDGQTLILRSTVYPGVTRRVEQLIERLGRDMDIAFCPERIAEGRAMIELFELPQIVSARTPNARKRVEQLFRVLTEKIVHLEPEEAELAKLFTNTWRYIKFATANQLYMIANDFDLDFERIRSALAEDYPRAADLPRAGFAAGPCLFKDTMQLAAFNDNNFMLGHAAMLVNEGLPLYLVSRLESRYDLAESTVGILGMSFKAESDDVRSSLSYKLKRILEFKAGRVLCTDPYVRTDDDLVPLEQVLEESNVIVIGAPHERYAQIRTSAEIVDVWGLTGVGVRV